MMGLKGRLDILLITYNRKKELIQTMEALLSAKSPVRQCNITVLDNCSEDGTSEVLVEYALKYTNVAHIRHGHNIGGNANYVRALEMASKEYFWVLCDDDTLDWASWKEFEKALLSGEYDLLQVWKGAQGTLGFMFHELSFVPGCLCRTKLVSGDVLNSMYMHMYTMFPQLVLAASALNTQKKIYRHPHDIVIRPDEDLKAYARGIETTGGIGNIFTQIDWLAGILTAAAMLEDKKIRRQVVRSTLQQIYPRHEEFYYKYAPHFFDGYYWQFIGPVWAALPIWDKLIFPWMMLLCSTKAGWWMAKAWRIFRTCLFNPSERARYWHKLKNKKNISGRFPHDC